MKEKLNAYIEEIDNLLDGYLPKEDEYPDVIYLNSSAGYTRMMYNITVLKAVYMYTFTPLI